MSSSFSRRKALVAALLPVAAVAAPAFALAQSDDHKMDHQMMDKMASSPMAPAMTAMHDGMAAHPMNGNADHDFTVVMLITAQTRMAAIKAELAKGTNASTKAIATKMQADTAAQITMLTNVLKNLGP